MTIRKGNRDHSFVKRIAQNSVPRGSIKGVITTVYPSIESDSNGVADVDSLETDESFSRIPMRVSRFNESPSFQETQLVIVSFLVSPNNPGGAEPYISGLLYSKEDQALETKKEEWRERFGDGAVIESINRDDDTRHIRLGDQPEDRANLDSGLDINVTDGKFEIYDKLKNGLCCDGQGNVVLSQVTGRGGGGGTGGGTAQNGPVDWTPTEPFEDVPLPETESVVNLNDLGLNQGDNIDTYFQENFDPGTLVLVEPGTYQWNGDGWPRNMQNMGLMTPAAAEANGLTEESSGGNTPGQPNNPVSPFELDRRATDGGGSGAGGQIVLQCGDGNNVNCRFFVGGGGNGSVHFQRITFKGVKESDSWLNPTVTDRQSSVFFDNVYFPDGGQGPTDAPSSNAMFVPLKHAGTIYLRNMLVGGSFTDNGIYGTAPGITSRGGKQGRIIAEGGLYRNNNVTNLRIGGNGSVARAITSVHDRTANATPKHNNNVNQRGIWIRDSAGEIIVEDCDFINGNGVNGNCITIGGGSGSHSVKSVQLNNNRFEANGESASVRIQEGQVSGSGNQFTGSNAKPIGGNLTNSCIGDSCESPDPSPRKV